MSLRAPGQSSKRALGSSSPPPATQTEAASASASSDSAPAQSQSKKAKTQPAAAASAAAPATSPPTSTLHVHALQSIFAFASLRDLCGSVSHVSRAWHSAAQSMPSVRAWLRLSQLSDGQLEDVSRELTMLSTIRQANGAPKQASLKKLRRMLRQDNCLTASKQLRALFDSMQIVHKEAGEKTGSARMRFTRPSAAMAPAASISSAAALISSSPPAVPATVDVTLAVSFDVDNDWSDEYSRENTHTILMGDTELVKFYRQTSNDGYKVHDSCYDTREMLSWMRGLGVMRGNRRQQVALLESAIRTLFDLCDSGSLQWWTERHSEACDEAYDEEAEEQQREEEDPEVPEEAEDDQEGGR